MKIKTGPYVKGSQCVQCETIYPRETSYMQCPQCGDTGILDILYAYDRLHQNMPTAETLQKRPFNIWRYKEWLSIPVADDLKTLHVGGTPLYRSDASLAKWGVEQLYIKDEGVNPTGSLKDRASVIAVAHAKSLHQPVVACSSTGNAASSLAGQAARLGLKSVIFVPERAPIGKLNQLLVYGAQVYKVKGDYQATYALSHEAIKTYGWYDRNAAVNPHLVEGKKTVAYEIIEQLGSQSLDWVVVSVGDGCTLAGLYKGFYDWYKLGRLSRIPRLLGVQSEGCAPLYKAWKTNQPLEVAEENTIADSIAVGIPRNARKALRAVEQSHGAWITVTDQAILDATKTLGRHEGIFAEPASSAAFAGLLKARETDVIAPSETVVVLHTGNGLKDPDSARKAVGDVTRIEADFKTFKKTWKMKE